MRFRVHFGTVDDGVDEGECDEELRKDRGSRGHAATSEGVADPYDISIAPSTSRICRGKRPRKRIELGQADIFHMLTGELRGIMVIGRESRRWNVIQDEVKDVACIVCPCDLSRGQSYVHPRRERER
jgi:hypothetical protein